MAGGKKNKHRKDDFSDDDLHKPVKSQNTTEEIVKTDKSRRRASKGAKADETQIEVAGSNEISNERRVGEESSHKKKNVPRVADPDADPFTPEEIMWLLSNGKKGKQIERSLTRDEIEFMKKRKIPVPTRKPIKKNAPKRSWKDDDGECTSTVDTDPPLELFSLDGSNVDGKIFSPKVLKCQATTEGPQPLKHSEKHAKQDEDKNICLNSSETFSLRDKAWQYEKWSVEKFCQCCQWHISFVEDTNSQPKKRGVMHISFSKRCKVISSIVSNEMLFKYKSSIAPSNSLLGNSGGLSQQSIHSPSLMPSPPPISSSNASPSPSPVSGMDMESFSYHFNFEISIPLNHPPLYVPIENAANSGDADDLPSLSLTGADEKLSAAAHKIFDVFQLERLGGMRKGSIRRPPPIPRSSTLCKEDSRAPMFVDGFAVDLITQGLNSLEDHLNLLANIHLKKLYEGESG